MAYLSVERMNIHRLSPQDVENLTSSKAAQLGMVKGFETMLTRLKDWTGKACPVKERELVDDFPKRRKKRPEYNPYTSGKKLT